MSHSERHRFYRRSGKRALDVSLVLLSLPLTLPLLALLAILVRRRLGSPVLFCQVRPGFHAQPFTLYKFRTMTDARDHVGTLLADSERLGAFGRWLRATSLDELPELWNVLTGAMSLVGPRPLLLEYLERYTPEQARRHDVRPGLTGWAQVHGRNALNWDERFARDVEYAAHLSLSLDLRILVLTVTRVLRRDGISAAGEATMPLFMGSASEVPIAEAGQRGMTLSIIIVNWNTRALLADCLASIADTAANLTPEIIVSDNGSTDGSRELCRERFPHVTFLENGANLGFAANNRGLAVARGDCCLLLNSDTLVLPGALQAAVAVLETQPRTGALGCMLLTPDGDVQRSVERTSSLWQSLRQPLLRSTPAHKRRDYYDRAHAGVDYVSGAFLLLRREALAAAGLFDEQFFMYAEEADLCLRIRRAGFAIAYTPAARIVHIGGGSASSAKARSVQRLVSRLRFLKKHHAPLYFQTFRLLSMARSLFDYALGRLDRDGLRRVLRAHRELSYGL